MGGKCRPSGGINPIFSDEIKNIKNIRGKPNSRTDLFNGLEELIQSRWYGGDSWAIWDRDYKHNDPNNTHTFPHDHEWFWNKKKGKDILDRSKELEINDGYC